MRLKTIYSQTYLIHTNPHINVEAPLGSGGPNGLLSRLQLWPPGLTKAPLGPGVENINPQNTPQETQIVKKNSPLQNSKIGKICWKSDKKQLHVPEADLDVEAPNRF